MAKRAGSADLPLHGGRVPSWLATRMSTLGRVITEAIVHHYGRNTYFSRLSDPFWFQSFGAVMGMDWHSSGITTSVMGALKRGLEPVADELGIYVCGGRGRHSRKTPSELTGLGERLGIDGDQLACTSRLVAKIDSAAVQDGFQLYLHSFVLASDGRWCVVQQGMEPRSRTARRYHWHSPDVTDFVCAPHAAIAGPEQGPLLNMVSPAADSARTAQLTLINESPDRLVSIWREVGASNRQLRLPHHHDVRADDVNVRRLHATLSAAAANGPSDYAELLLTGGLGARTVEALAHIAQVVHGTPVQFEDPARFSFALGGKDGHPFPVPLAVYDETIKVLKRALENARLGRDERLTALRRLDRQARALDGVAAGVPFELTLQREAKRVRRYRPRAVNSTSSRSAAPSRAARRQFTLL